VFQTALFYHLIEETVDLKEVFRQAEASFSELLNRMRRSTLSPDDIEVLRGIEGARVKESYRLAAARFGIEWHGRKYDRGQPEAADLPNQAINHAATAVSAAASVAVAAVSALPQLGFIHEDSDQSFVLDIADLFREEITLDVAFGAVTDARRTGEGIDRAVRRRAGRMFRQRKVLPAMIDRIKTLFEVDVARDAE
jgi:CRISPR-associated protein Cas1